MNRLRHNAFDPSPRVSVIMPAYNGERYIAQSIQSVLAQTYPQFELIVIDDGSHDRTSEIVAQLQQTDDRIVYLRQENAGQANARNRGINESRGDLIAFLDQDDLWIENKLEIQIRELDKTRADLVFSNGYVFTGDDVSFEEWLFPTVAGTFSGAEMFRLLFKQNRIPVLTALVRKAALDSIGSLDEDPQYQHSDDYDLWLRLASGGATFLGLEDKLVRYRSHSGQASNDKVRMLVAELAVLRKHEQTDLLTAKEKLDRFASLYDDLILALVDDKRFHEARSRLTELHSLLGPKPDLRVRAALLKLMPGCYRAVLEFVQRGRASYEYRIGRRSRIRRHGAD